MPGLEGGPRSKGCGRAPGPLLIFTSSYLMCFLLHLWLPSQISYLIIKAAMGSHPTRTKLCAKLFWYRRRQRVMVKGNLSLWPRSWAAWAGVWVCIGWLPVIYLFSWSKRRGEKKEPSMGGMGEYEDLCEPWIYEREKQIKFGASQMATLHLCKSFSLTQSGRHWQPSDISVLSSRGVPAGIPKAGALHCRAERSYTFGRWGTKQPLSLLVFLHLFFCRFFLHL